MITKYYGTKELAEVIEKTPRQVQRLAKTHPTLKRIAKTIGGDLHFQKGHYLMQSFLLERDRIRRAKAKASTDIDKGISDLAALAASISLAATRTRLTTGQLDRLKQAVAPLSKLTARG